MKSLIDYVKNQFGRRVSHLNRHNIHLFAWTSVWTEGIYHKYHSHQDSIVSGTYYPINERKVIPMLPSAFSENLCSILEGQTKNVSTVQMTYDITNGELITYLKQNVSEEAFMNNRQQEPMLSGDPNKILIKFN